MRPVALLLLAITLFLTSAAEARTKRSHAAKVAFARQNPCPATGLRKPSCPGYVIDHVEPLCAGGADRPSNMQWQAKAEAKEKDKLEIRQCRYARRAGTLVSQ